MKSKTWPQRPRKWPLDLNNLGRGFKNTSFSLSVLRGYQEVVENWNFKCLSRKPSYSSFFSAWSPDFKKVIFEKNCWANFEVVEVKRSFSRSQRPNFGFHLVLTSFHLEISSFGISRLFDLGNLSVLENGTQTHFENGLKSIQIFQRLMGGMNRRERLHLNQMSSAVRSET